ncbi:ABC transporter substrate-binding protein [Streptomyces sp. NBC_00083]|uniref:ABC transporter substrate-binding protein n=1 Tax=Streptomyces sp. NBC_00083 TaxID=2975647 RepID=UPI002251490E|nr:ABC transporter substrate-binding protein [Streptomyces sp. NBC_00083]MCX5382192.1 ABC transporter substrate-binding protein [Streptomyces sp. NBC_00083]
MLWRRAALAAALLFPLAACTTPAQPDAAGPAAPGFPYTVTNCGVTTTYTAPPKRAVTMNQHTTEVMLELGLAQSLAGTAYLDDAVLPKYAADYRSVPVLAAEYPSYEKLLAANPDFVYGGYASAFAANEGRGREALAKSGIKTRLNVENCPRAAATTMDDVYAEVREVGRTFGVPDRAEAWVKSAEATNAKAAPAGAAPVPVFVYDSGDAKAFTVGGKGIGNDIVTRAGGRNIFADDLKTTSFGDASWENVVARAPETILVLDYGGTSVEAKKKRLRDDPALASVPAVKNNSFAVLALSDMVTGVRAPDAVARLAAQLRAGR